MLGGNAARRALRRRVDVDYCLNARRPAQGDAVDTPEEWAKHAYRDWPCVRRMKMALSGATAKTRAKAMPIILELRARDLRVATGGTDERARDKTV